ncbi:hypothetical protein [Eggerthella sinensis]|uniref:hypothetical protein n=1 Tax=Eggerthella sinensis TaxID=242230 RepID=UPI00248DC37E|nr:hypothetical protein [Eggerthella sinensis]
MNYTISMTDILLAVSLETPLGTIGLAAAILVIVAALYAISATISTRLYAKREL